MADSAKKAQNPGPSSIKERTLSALVNSVQPMTVLNLSRYLGVKKSVLNKHLYELLQRGKVQIGPESPPLWTATVGAVDSIFDEKEAHLLALLCDNRNVHGVYLLF